MKPISLKDCITAAQEEIYYGEYRAWLTRSDCPLQPCGCQDCELLEQMIFDHEPLWDTAKVIQSFRERFGKTRTECGSRIRHDAGGNRISIHRLVRGKGAGGNPRAGNNGHRHSCASGVPVGEDV